MILRQMQIGGQPIRVDGPESHLITKKGTPTMGGVFIIFSMLVSTSLWVDLTNAYIWVIILVTLGFAALGFLDDYRKLCYKNSKGISAKTKLVWQCLLAMLASYAVAELSVFEIRTSIFIPFFKNYVLHLGPLYFIFTMLVIAGASNAVNVTDGLDGLASVPIIMVSCCFAFISYMVGHAKFAEYLQLHYIAGVGEIAVLCAALIGSCLGFLWYNTPPAQIFMGDVGSLALGAVIGVISVITKHEIVLFITGGLFVIEALSVIVQVASFKLYGRRVFKMAPIHHHFEKLGWSEPTIVIRFWIIAFVFALLGVATLKLR